ncbi:MAG: SRPBCC family protein [Pedobacter sp.]|nr:SRPBCC family protein [Pedobacter sp.]
MTIIESEVAVGKPIEQVYAFLANMNNHKQLMPPNIYNWESTEDEANFTIQNMAKLALKINQRIENKELTAIPSEKPPFELELKWIVSVIDDANTRAKLMISADLNPMMKMIASGPLQKLVNHQTQKLQELFNSQFQE